MTNEKTVANDSERQQASLYLLHLMRCALNDLTPNPKPDAVGWNLVYKMATRNSVQGLTWFAAKQCANVPDSLRATWEDDANKVLYKHAMFDIEREAVCAAMAQQGLSYLPLKGVQIMPCYPRPEMRSFCDNDILYGYVEPNPQGGYRICGETEKEQEATAHRGVKDLTAIMEARGYETKNAHVGNHEMYLKKPFYNFEMHRKLMSLNSSLHAYYENPWKRAIRDEEAPFAYHFTDEDEYLYMIAHAFKHFDCAGCGVRILADILVFTRAKKTSLNWGYISQELNKMGIADFEQKTRELAFAGLDKNGKTNLTASQQELLFYMVGSGTYGTTDQRITNSIRKKTQGDTSPKAKMRYLWHRLVRDEAFIKENFPAFYRYKVLRPFFPIYRIGRALARNQKSTWHEVRRLCEGDDSKQRLTQKQR